MKDVKYLYHQWGKRNTDAEISRKKFKVIDSSRAQIARDFVTVAFSKLSGTYRKITSCYQWIPSKSSFSYIYMRTFLSWFGVSWMLWASLFLRCKRSRIPWRPGRSSGGQRAGRLCAQTLAGGLVICVAAEQTDHCTVDGSESSDELC